MISSCGREVLFSPEDPVRSRLLAVIEDCKMSIDLHAYVLTLDPLTDVLVALRKQDRQVRVIVSRAERPSKKDDSQKRQIDRLQDAGCQVACGLSVYDGLLHGKYGIVDGPYRLPSSCAFHGSYNFSYPAQNQGNHLTIEHQPEDIRPWEEEFDREFSRLTQCQ